MTSRERKNSYFTVTRFSLATVVFPRAVRGHKHRFEIRLSHSVTQRADNKRDSISCGVFSKRYFIRLLVRGYRCRISAGARRDCCGLQNASVAILTALSGKQVVARILCCLCVRFRSKTWKLTSSRNTVVLWLRKISDE